MDTNRHGWITALVVVLSIFVGTVIARSEVPKVDSLFPAGGQRGTEFEVTVTGKLEPWPLSAACDEPQVTFAPIEKQKGKFTVKVGSEVGARACLVRFFNRDGASAPRQFVIGPVPERAQSGAGLMRVSGADFPLSINGRLDSGGDVDRFAIELEAGQQLVASVTAYAIDSPMDPLLHLHGPGGERLAFNHDADRVGLDPRLVFSAPRSGTYELQLSAFAYPPQANIRLAGGATSVYRLTLAAESPAIELPEGREAGGEGVQPVTIPTSLGGRIDPAGDVDRFKFAAKKGQLLRFEVAAAAVGSWMDAVLVIEDAAGKELERHDDIDRKTNHDVSLDWQAPADGEFVAKVMDLNRAGGSDLVYKFEISEREPSFSAAAPAGVYAIPAGGKLEIAVKTARLNGYRGGLEVGADGLPAGVSAVAVAVPGKGGEVKLNLVASADAAPANGPISVWIAPEGTGPGARVKCQFDLKGAFADAGDLLVNSTDRAWLTVLEAKKK